MKAADRSIWALTSHLASTYSKLPESSDEAIEALRSVADAGDHRALPVVFAFVWGTVQPLKKETDRFKLLRRVASGILGTVSPAENAPRTDEVRSAALETARCLISGMNSHDIPELDRLSRFPVGAIGGLKVVSNEWNWVPSPLPSDIPGGPSRISLLGFLAANANGRTREAAVIELAACSNGDEIRYLLWRMTDWVEPVRRRAMEAIRQRLRPEFAAQFIAAFPLLRRLDGMKRVDLSEIRTEIRSFLLDEACRPILMSAFDSGDRLIRREACRVLDFSEGPPPGEALQRIEQDPDAVVRSWLIPWEVRLRPIDATAAAALRASLFNDPSTAIRRQTLFAVVEMNDPVMQQLLERALFDRSAMIRHSARFHLKEAGTGSDFASIYRSAIENGDRSIAAILGFGETAAPSDWRMLLPLLKGRPREARAALQAMARLDTDAVQDVLVDALADPREGVCRQALRLLATRLSEAEAPTLRNLWTKAETQTSWAAIATAILRLPPWPALDILLDLVGSDLAAPDAEIVASRLLMWRPSTRPLYPAEPPSPQLEQTLRDKLDRVRSLVPDEVAALIEHGMTGSWTPIRRVRGWERVR